MRGNVEPTLLELDLAAHGDLPQLWADLTSRVVTVAAAVAEARGHIVARMREGKLGPRAFRATWEQLGFAENATRASTPADDWLEGLLEVPRLATDHERPDHGQVNLASRAVRIAEFLATLEPGPGDVVYDLGAGCGKFVTTVAASTQARVIGVELGETWVTSSRETAARLGVTNAEHLCADVRDVDLTNGTQFYLYHPFYGSVARDTAQKLAAVAAQKAIAVYLQGPSNGFGEHFERHVRPGAFKAIERRGPITVLKS
ncbi:MAG: methyltransferase domain-containing protein [Myxococcaceae bacterium]|nr:methyltransferase domain-containing protein [Myxococcaceae bacterium]